MGDWKSFNPAAFEHACKDAKSASDNEMFKRAFDESTNGISNLKPSRYTEGRIDLAFPYPKGVLERVHAHLINGNPALAPHLCIDGSSLYYTRAPGCPRTLWEKMLAY